MKTTWRELGWNNIMDKGFDEKNKTYKLPITLDSRPPYLDMLNSLKYK